MNTNKRRRLDEASAKLTRPFRSPLKASAIGKEEVTCAGHNTQGNHHHNINAVHEYPKSPRKGGDDDGFDSFASLPSPDTLIHNPTHSYKQSLPASHASNASPQAVDNVQAQGRSVNTGDPQISALQKIHASLNAELSTLTNNLDTLKQSHKILTTASDTELEKLVCKWRSAAREAAEELFSTAKDRVNKMGGVGVLRERMAKRAGSFGDDGDGLEGTTKQGWPDQENGIDEDELNEEQKEILETIREERKRDEERYGSVTTNEDRCIGTDAKFNGKGETFSSGKDDDSFTIDMMLQQLNVELEVIGYDKDLQRWLD